MTKANAARRASPVATSAPVLWIGRSGGAPASVHVVARRGGLPDLQFLPVSLRDLTANLLAEIGPAAAFSLLSWPEGDAVEAAQRLHAIGFRGIYRVFAARLPDRTLIEREVRIEAPGLDFAVIDVDAAVEARRAGRS